MEAIFHEKQDGSLCAQHCLNALLQGEYFTAVDLATLAQNLDDAERQHMAEGGIHSEEYRRFLQQPSINMDDSGYFSVQVIASALKVWSLELIPFNSQNPIALIAKNNPERQSAFICNYKDHWFTIRKLGIQWFNLNSLLSGPELLSDCYLIMFLAQLQQEGYSIFIVLGKLPECEADKLLRLKPAVQPVKPKLLSELRNAQQTAAPSWPSDGSSSSQVATEQEIIEEEQLQEALRRSLEENTPSSSEPVPVVSSSSSRTEAVETVDINEVRRKRLEHMARVAPDEAQDELTSSDSQVPSQSNGVHTQGTTIDDEADMTEEEMLEAAIKMSMENS